MPRSEARGIRYDDPAIGNPLAAASERQFGPGSKLATHRRELSDGELKWILS